jgi:hypothetical protein
VPTLDLWCAAAFTVGPVVALVILILVWLRWGERTVYLDMTAAQAAPAIYARRHGSFLRARLWSRPSGLPLLNMGVLDKVKVYRNGIYARFCRPTRGYHRFRAGDRYANQRWVLVGRSRYAFVRYEDITGIFPMEVELVGTGHRPYRRTDRGVQIEIVDLRMCFIGSEYDQASLMHALREGMGTLFDRRCRPGSQLLGRVEEISWEDTTVEQFDDPGRLGDGAASVAVASAALHRHEVLRARKGMYEQ